MKNNLITFCLISLLLFTQINCFKQHRTDEKENQDNDESIQPEKDQNFLDLLLEQNPALSQNSCINQHLSTCAQNFMQQGLNPKTQQKLISQIQKLKKAQTHKKLNSQKLYQLNYQLIEDQETGQFWSCAKLTSENICQNEIQNINFADFAPTTDQFFKQQNSLNKENDKNNENQQNSLKKHEQTKQPIKNTSNNTPYEQEEEFWNCLLRLYENCAHENGMKIIDYQEFQSFLAKLDLYVQTNRPNVEEILEYSATLLEEDLPQRDFFSCMSMGAMMQCGLLDYMSASGIDDGF